MPANPDSIAIPQLPSSLSRAEKVRFRQFIQARIEAGRPVSALKLDRVGDLIACRTRISLLNKMLRANVAERSTFTNDRAEAIVLSKAIDAAVKLAVKLEDAI